MNVYRKLLDEIQNGTSQNALRKSLLAGGCTPDQQPWEAQLPVSRNYVGPRPWYNLIEEIARTRHP